MKTMLGCAGVAARSWDAAAAARNVRRVIKCAPPRAWPRLPALLFHRAADSMFARELCRFIVTGVGVPDDAEPGIARQHTLQPPLRLLRAVRAHHHSGVLGIADPHAAAVVDRDPRCPGRGV